MCFHPLSAFLWTRLTSSKSGSKRWVHIRGAFDGSVPPLPDADTGLDVQHILLPCGQCMACRLRRSLEWTIRCCHEQSLRGPGSFVTLTFSDDTVPKLPDGRLTLDYRPFQLFMKRLRKEFPDQQIRFLMCGEYGSKTKRPHFHVILFGFSFPDAKPWGEYFRSPTLERLWKEGYSLIGNVTQASINYVCRYNLKKITGKNADEWYAGRMPEFVRMSNRPGIGADWLSRFHNDVYKYDAVADMVVRDAVRLRAHDCRVPRYYDKLMESLDPTTLQIIRDFRAAENEAKPLPTVPELRMAEDYSRYVGRQNLMAKFIRDRKRGKSHV